MSDSPVTLGLNARLFPNNWRPALREIDFARRAGFQAIQFPGKENGLDEELLGNSFTEVAAALQQGGIHPVMEIVVHLEKDGRTVAGKSPLEVLQANLPAIQQLGCRRVHWHLVANAPLAIEDYAVFETRLIPQFRRAVELAAGHGFGFGIEHNEPDLRLFGSPRQCRAILEAVPGLALVWDTNHTTAADYPAFMDLLPRFGLLHISDTRLPEVNYHLPIGMGNMDFKAIFAALVRGGFQGIGILEIGGLPKSGGYGRDSDEALIHSLDIIRQAIGVA